MGAGTRCSSRASPKPSSAPAQPSIFPSWRGGRGACGSQASAEAGRLQPARSVPSSYPGRFPHGEGPSSFGQVQILTLPKAGADASSPAKPPPAGRSPSPSPVASAPGRAPPGVQASLGRRGTTRPRWPGRACLEPDFSPTPPLQPRDPTGRGCPRGFRSQERPAREGRGSGSSRCAPLRGAVGVEAVAGTAARGSCAHKCRLQNRWPGLGRRPSTSAPRGPPSPCLPEAPPPHREPQDLHGAPALRTLGAAPSTSGSRGSGQLTAGRRRAGGSAAGGQCPGPGGRQHRPSGPGRGQRRPAPPRPARPALLCGSRSPESLLGPGDPARAPSLLPGAGADRPQPAGQQVGIAPRPPRRQYYGLPSCFPHLTDEKTEVQRVEYLDVLQWGKDAVTPGTRVGLTPPPPAGTVLRACLHHPSVCGIPVICCILNAAPSFLYSFSSSLSSRPSSQHIAIGNLFNVRNWNVSHTICVSQNCILLSLEHAIFPACHNPTDFSSYSSGTTKTAKNETIG